jgi:micrococcal nuclease
MFSYKVKTVDRVVDGDTVDITVDLGFSIYHKMRIRLAGINTPEVRTRDLVEKEKGILAKERLQELLISCFLDDKHYLRLTTMKEKGKYGRYIGTFHRVSIMPGPDEELEVDINELLVEEGHAERYYG